MIPLAKAIKDDGKGMYLTKMPIEEKISIEIIKLNLPFSFKTLTSQKSFFNFNTKIYSRKELLILFTAEKLFFESDNIERKR